MLQRLSQRTRRPLPALFLKSRARLVRQSGLCRDRLRHQKEFLHPTLRRPNLALRTTLLASPGRAVALRQLHRSEILPSAPALIGSPRLPGCAHREVEIFPLQSPRPVREPEQMTTIRRRICRRSRLRHRLIRSRRRLLSLHTLVDRGRGMPVPKPNLVRRRRIIFRKRQRHRWREQNLPQPVDRNILRRLYRLGRNLHRLLRRKCRRIVLHHLTG